MSNAAQAEHWNGPAGRRWASRRERTDYRLENIQRALMAFAAPARDMNVLDIGCGCGTATLNLARVVAPGRVVGVDISAHMIETARQRAAGTSIEFVEADASVMQYRPEFDLVFSRFGVMFFADPAAAFAHIRTALKPGGRLAFCCWCAMKENDWVSLPFETARDLLPKQAPPDHSVPGPFAFAESARVRDILSHAGFENIRIERCNLPVKLGAKADEAADEALNSGALLHATADLDESVRESIRARLRNLMAQHATPEGITLPGACWLVGAN